MESGGHRHTSAALFPWKERTEPPGQDAGWTVDAVAKTNIPILPGIELGNPPCSV